MKECEKNLRVDLIPPRAKLSHSCVWLKRGSGWENFFLAKREISFRLSFGILYKTISRMVEGEGGWDLLS